MYLERNLKFFFEEKEKKSRRRRIKYDLTYNIIFTIFNKFKVKYSNYLYFFYIYFNYII